jgi:hypothetical protein
MKGYSSIRFCGRFFAALLTVSAVWLAASPCLAGLVGYWSFDGDVLDHSGLGNHGTLNGGAFSSDVPAAIGAGGSLRLQGGIANGTAERVNVNANVSLNARYFTLAYWFKDPGQTTGSGTTFGSQGHNRFTGRQSFTFDTAVANSADAGGNRHMKVYTGAWASTGYATTGEWTHAAWVNGGGSLRLYINGALAYTSLANPAPSGSFVIGAQFNNGEGFAGWMDDVAMWNEPLPEAAIAALAAGTFSPLTLPANVGDILPPTHRLVRVGTNVGDWRRSTQTTSGGAAGTWDQSGVVLPPAATYTEAVSPTSTSLMAHINNAALDLGVTGLVANPDVHYYRTTFDLETVQEVSAKLHLAVDNGAQVYINGQLVAAETSFVAANWGRPYSSLAINTNGSISGVTLFDQVAAGFSGWQVGQNELVVAVRNPSTEAAPAGGFALRMEVLTVVPEPSSWVLGTVALAVVLPWMARRRSRNHN